MAHAALWPLVVHFLVTPAGPGQPAPLTVIVEKAALPLLQQALKPAQVVAWPLQIAEPKRRRK